MSGHWKTYDTCNCIFTQHFHAWLRSYTILSLSIVNLTMSWLNLNKFSFVIRDSNPLVSVFSREHVQCQQARLIERVSMRQILTYLLL